MNVADIYSVDVLIGIGSMGLIGALLGGKSAGGRLFSMLAAWVILISVWPVALAVMLAVAAVGMGVIDVIAGVEIQDAGHGILAKGLTFGLLLAIYGKIVWEEMHSPENPRGAYVAGPPKSPLTKEPWR